ncbi:unnamed protein product [Caenorhabditis auriculariae]|uniref:Exosome complex component 10 homolog n=1 Tax=Caenorhabditis auriculariae TaxID=2777116 RepID=A0A8S1HFN7_9PELO|nr:unnamed protein product [Caenorhabditis auriculariae]
MPRKTIAMVRRSTNRGEKPQQLDGTPSIRQPDKTTQQELERRRSDRKNALKLYSTAEQDEDWEPSTSSIVKLLISLRVSSALWNIIGDCDEVYNYWEPLHMFLYGHGFQTWEYSPLYAIRSYFYVYLHYIPASVFAFLLAQSKIAVFVCTRCIIGSFTLFGEYQLYRAVSRKLNINTGRVFLLFSLLSTGMFISSTAFLPSSFAMSLNLYIIAAYLTEKWAIAITCTAFSTMVGWPFSAVLGLPVVIEMLYNRSKDLRVSFFIWSILSAMTIGTALVLCDSYYFGRRVFAPLNIVVYNVLSGPGPELYGTEPLSFYIKNLLLNWNIVFPLALSALPLSAFCYYVHFPPRQTTATRLGIPCDIAYWRRYTPVFLIWLTAAVWCVIFFSQPHKEERFLFPIYPNIALLAAIAFDALARLLPRYIGSISNYFWMIYLTFIVLSLSRTYSLSRNFGSQIEIYKSFSEHVITEDIDFSVRNNPLRLCVGKEWYRFPSSFFLPEKTYDSHGNSRGIELRFLASEFRGLLPKPFAAGSLPNITRLVPIEMNDLNKEEPSRYVSLDSCDFVIDVDAKATGREPNFREMRKILRPVNSLPFLVAEESHPLLRAFFVPFLNVSNEEELSSSESNLPSAELKQNVADILKCGANLVRTSKALPRMGGDFELYNSFPAFNSLMKKQEERILLLEKRLARALGCPLRFPAPDAPTKDFTECFIEGQDNIAERAATLLDALKKAGRDEVVKVPAVILRAGPTHQRTKAEIAAAMKTFSANIGSALAQKFREHREAAVKQSVREKPQKTFSLPVDNSNAPFVSKLKVKHHATSRRNNLVVVDDDSSGRREWQTAVDETEEEHPYMVELLNFNVPSPQLQHADPILFDVLENTPVTIVATKEQLECLLNKLKNVKEFAVDVEANDMRSYMGLTCLVQISTRTEDFIIDPFPVWESMGILNEVFADPSILKVFHGAGNDVLWLQRDFGIHIVNMFDTYFAMKKLKYSKFSLAHLVAKHASVALDKQYQLADWRLRPLQDAMLNYAREDTHYLLYCFDKLREELLNSPEGSPQLLREVYQDAVEICLKVFKKPVFNQNGYLSEIKLRFSLNNRQESALVGLYKWRDTVAREEDENVQYILPNHMLLALAETIPRDVSGIYACCNPLPHAVRERLGEVLKIITTARDAPLEKKKVTYEELDDAHESRGVVNHRMDENTAVLRTKLDFSHAKFDEERGDVLIDLIGSAHDVGEKTSEESFLSLLAPEVGSKTELRVLSDDEGSSNWQKLFELCLKISKDLESWATPYECYTLAIKEKEKQVAEEKLRLEKLRAENGEVEGEKKMFTHLDPTVCRKPVFEDKISNLGELKMANENEDIEKTAGSSSEKEVVMTAHFDEDQLLSKKALKRRQRKARDAADIPTEAFETANQQKNSTVVGKRKSGDIGEDGPREKRQKEEVQDFDYSKEDSSIFYGQLANKKQDFDPFHQQMRSKEKNKKKRGKAGQKKERMVTTPRLREMRATVGDWRAADGSCSFSQGNTSVCASCNGPGDVHASRVDDERMVLEVSYRQNCGDNKFHPLNSILSSSIQTVLNTEIFPRTSLVVTIHGLQDDGSIDAAAINATCFALVDSGLPMKSLFCGVKVVLLNDDIIVDPTAQQEKAARAAYLFSFSRSSKGEAEVLTMDCSGVSSLSQVEAATQLAQQGALSVFGFYRSIFSSKLKVDDSAV